ncbi:unnamed protein product [Coregonus sp. 'balchen']|nr:unnamed protein product [Coregonus sp. 'balchen']
MVKFNYLSLAPVILDPNTADTGLILSRYLTIIGHRDKALQLPDNPERVYGCVLGSEDLEKRRKNNR